MLNVLIAAAAFCVCVSGAALAGATVAKPASADECLKTAFEIAQAAEAKTLPDADYKKFEEMMTELEGQCDAQQFDAAVTTAGNLQGILASAP